MTTETSPDPPPQRRKRRRRWLWRVPLGLVVLLVGVYLLRGPLLAAPLGSYVSARLTERLGFEVTVARVEGGWFSDAVLVDVRGEAPRAGSTLRSFACPRLAVTYDLSTVLRDPVQGVRSIEASGLDLTVRADRRAEEGGTTNLREVLGFVPDGVKLALDGRLHVIQTVPEPADVVRLEHFAVNGSTDALTLTLKGISSPYLPAERIEGPLRLSVRRPSPTKFALAMETPLLGVTIDGLQAGLGDDNTWQVHLDGQLGQGTIAANWNEGPVTGVITALKLDALPDWVRTRIEAKTTAPTAGELTGKFRLLPDTRALEVTVSVRDVAWRNLRADVVDVEARLDSDGPQLQAATVRRGDAVVRVDDVQFDFDAPYSIASIRAFSVEAPDLEKALLDAGIEVPGDLRGDAIRAQMEGAVITPGVVTFTQLDVSNAGLQVKGAAQLTLPDDVATESEGDAWERAELTAKLSGSLDVTALPARLPSSWRPKDPRGVVSFEAEASGTLRAPLVDLAVSGENLALGEERLHHLKVLGQFSREQVRDLDLTVRSSLGEGHVAGSYAFDSREFTVTSRGCEVPSLTALRRVFSDSSLLARFGGSIKAAGWLKGRLQTAQVVADPEEWLPELPASLTGQLQVTARQLTVDDTRIGRVDATVEAKGRTLHVDPFDLDGPLGKVLLVGTLNLSDRVLHATSLAVSVEDWRKLDRWFPEVAPLRGSSTFGGSFSLPLRDPLRTVGSLAATVDSIEREGLTATDLDVRAVLERDLWRIDRAEARVQLRNGERVWDEQISLKTPAAIRTVPGSDDRTFEVTDLRVLGARVTAKGRIGDVIAVRASATGVETERLLPGDLQGRLDVTLSANGTSSSLTSVELDASSKSLQFGPMSGPLALHVRQGATSTELVKLRFDGGEWGQLDGQGQLPWRVDWDGSRASVSSRPMADGAFHLALDSKSPGTWLEQLGIDVPQQMEFGAVHAEARCDARGARLTTTWSDFAWRGQKATRLAATEPLRLTVDAGPTAVQATLEGGAPLGVTGNLRSNGRFDWAAPWTWLDAAADAEVDGKVSIDIGDLAPFAIFSSDLVFARGSLRGELAVSGALQAPVLRGEVIGKELTARVAGELPVLDRGDVHVRFSPDAVEIERCTARLGYAPLELSGQVKRDGKGGAMFDLRVKGSRALLARSEYIRLRADLDVTVTGPLGQLLIAGEANVTDALFTRPLDLLGGGGGSSARDFELFSLRTPPLSTAKFDVRVRAASTIRVSNNRARGNVSADLRIVGTGEVPTPRGRVTLDEGMIITLPFSRLEAQRGEMTFREDRPFDPDLSLVATTRMKGYDLTVDVSGRASEARVDVSSLPALPPEHALLLLSTGATPIELERDGLSAAALTRAGTLIGTRIVDWFTGPGDPDSTSLLDRVTLEIGRDVSRSGAETVDAEVELTPRWFLRAERDRYDAYNGGLVWRVRFR